MKYTDDAIIEAVRSSETVSDVMRKLGMKITGGSHAHLSKRIKKIGIDTSHFTGCGHCRGKKSPKKLSADTVLVLDRLNGRKENIEKLRRSLHEIIRIYVCAVCGQMGVWNGKLLQLQIDHINGNPLDNRRENLRWICPNCHTQTLTFCNKARP